MTTAAEQGLATLLDNVKGTHEALSARRVFGEAYELDGVTVIPVARVSGGAGGGGGEGTDEGETGSGFGGGFGLNARPVGVYEVRDGSATWKPAIDVNRCIRGGQVLCGIVVVCATLVRLARRD